MSDPERGAEWYYSRGIGTGMAMAVEIAEELMSGTGLEVYKALVAKKGDMDANTASNRRDNGSDA